MSLSLELLRTWKQSFLTDRKLDWPEGWPLFRYRMTQDEFEALSRLLRDGVQAYGLAPLAERNDFQSLFVLYASGWWSRRYDGHQWAWEPLVAELGARADDWNQAQRSCCVSRGLAAWKRSLGTTSGLRFLGAIAVEGGLPMKLMAEARGRIGAMLGRVLQLSEGGVIHPQTLRAWIESLKHQLPASYQKEEVYNLLTDVVCVTLELKQAGGLTAGCDAPTQLDRTVPDWRRRFPLSLEDEHAAKLVEQLVKEAAQVRIEQRSLIAPLKRSLRFEDGIWHLRSELPCGDKLSGAALSALFDTVEAHALPRLCELTLSTDGGATSATLRKLAGADVWRVTTPLMYFADDAAVSEHMLELSTAGGATARTPVPLGVALEADLPWLFADEAHDYAFRRQGGGGLSSPSVLVAVPADWMIEVVEGVETDIAGRLWNNRTLYRTRGRTVCLSPEGERYTIRTAQAEAEAEEFSWSGARLWPEASTPRQIFKGMPRVQRRTGRAQPTTEREMPVTTSAGSGRYGAVTLRYPATGEIRYRSRVIVLPETAHIDMLPETATRGMLRLVNWRVDNARLITAGGHCVVHREHDALSLDCESEAAPPPELLEFELFWTGNTTPALVTLPFPGKGARGFDGANRQIESGALLDMGSLFGIRLRAIGHGYPKVSLRLASSDASLPPRFHSLKFPPDSHSIEVRLLDYLIDIQQLLALTEGVDGYVKVSLRVGESEASAFKLRIAGYTVALNREGSTAALPGSFVRNLSVESLTRLNLHALRLDHPEDEAVLLHQTHSEGVPTGAWDFDSVTREPGAWLIYPAADAPFAIRPLLWTVSGAQSDTTIALIDAMAVASPIERREKLDAAIQAMCSDYSLPDWVAMEQLASQVGHLPLPSLDLWKRLAHNPAAMAALAFRFSNVPTAFKLRFANELPTAWEAISLATWQIAISKAWEHLKALHDDAIANVIWKAHLQATIDNLAEVCPALNFLLGIAAACISPEHRSTAQRLRFFDGRAALFEGDDNALQKLRRAHADDNWPTEAKDLIRAARAEPRVARYLHPQEGFNDSVIDLPLLLAAEVTLGDTQKWFELDRMRMLRAHRAFDPDWFDEAYNMTIARCLADNNIPL